MARTNLSMAHIAACSVTEDDEDFSDSVALTSHSNFFPKDSSQHSGGPTPRPVFKDSHAVFVKRMQKLYPYVDQKKQPLPSSWNSDDKNDILGIAEMGLRVYFKGKTSKDPASIRADHPIPIRCGVYYFEVKVIKGQEGCMGIGLCERNVSLTRLPGWDRYSYGYHGDDGHFFSFSGNGDTYGPTFTSGDVVGCGIDLINRHIFFTKNGKHLGLAAREVERVDELFPTVGLQTTGEMVEANFGQRPFVFDIQSEIKAVRENMYKLFLEIDLPPEKTNWFNRAVASFLSHSGFPKALAAFNNETKTQYAQPNELVETRGKIKTLVLNRRFAEVIRVLDEIYPSLLTSNRELNLVLHCQQFVDMALDLAKQEAKTAQAAGPSSAGAGSSGGAGSTRGGPSLEALSQQTVNPHKRRGSRTDSETRRGSGSTAAAVAEEVEYPEGAEGDNERDEVDEEPARRRRTPHSRRLPGRPDSSTSSNGAAASSSHVQDIVMEEAENGEPRNGNAGPSHRNGAEHNGKCKNGTSAPAADTSTFIVSEEDDEDDILDAPLSPLDAKATAESHSFYSTAEMAGYEKYEVLRAFGQKVHEIQRQINRVPKELKQYVNEALSMICVSDVASIEQSTLRSTGHVETLAAAVNTAIREFNNEPALSEVSKRFMLARDLRKGLVDSRVLGGLFAEPDLMIFGGEPIPVTETVQHQGIF